MVESIAFVAIQYFEIPQLRHLSHSSCFKCNLYSYSVICYFFYKGNNIDLSFSFYVFFAFSLSLSFFLSTTFTLSFSFSFFFFLSLSISLLFMYLLQIYCQYCDAITYEHNCPCFNIILNEENI